MPVARPLPGMVILWLILLVQIQNRRPTQFSLLTIYLDLLQIILLECLLERHEVLEYMEDAVQQLLEHREENPKVNPTKFFSD